MACAGRRSQTGPYGPDINSGCYTKHLYALYAKLYNKISKYPIAAAFVLTAFCSRTDMQKERAASRHPGDVEYG